MLVKTSMRHSERHRFGLSLTVRLLLTVIFALSLYKLAFAEVPDRIRFESVSTKQGVSIGYVDTILQDSEGFIWMGTEMGLVRYDGYQFTVYVREPGNPNSLGGKTVLSFTEGADHTLWIGTDTGGLYRYNRDQDNFTRFQHEPGNAKSLRSDSVRRVIVAKDGTLFVALTGHGVFKMTALGEFEPLVLPGGSDPIGGDYTWCLFEDSQQHVWVGTDGDGVTRYNPDTGAFQVYSTVQASPYRIAHDTVRSIHQDTTGYIWLGTDGGVHRLDMSGRVEKHWQQGPDKSKNLRSNIVWDIYQDMRGDFWIGTDGGGLNVIDGKTGEIKYFLHDPLDKYSLSSNVVREIMEDSNGDIWTANYPSGANVFHRDSEHVTFYRSDAKGENSLKAPSVLSFLDDREDYLWIGTDGGGLSRLEVKTGDMKHYVHSEDPNSLSANAILSLSRDPSGKIWVGTWGGSLNLFDPETERFKRYPANLNSLKSPSQRNIWSSLVDHDGDLWIGTEGVGVNLFERNSELFSRFPFDVAVNKDDYGKIQHKGDTAWGLTNGLVWSIIQDSSGYIWLGTTRGLSRYNKKDNTFTHYFNIPGDDRSLSNDFVFSLHEDSQGKIWVGTKGGVNIFDASTAQFTRITLADGLSSDSIKSIIEGPDGRFWFGTTNGLIRYDPATRHIQNYNQSDWAKGKFNNGASLQLKSGAYVFGSVNGVVKFKPELLGENTKAPPIEILAFELYNKVQHPSMPGSPLDAAIGATKRITLDHTQSVFAFEYVALNYIGTQNNKYAYRLQGFDEDWHFVGHERKATYTNLSAGHYRFQVIGANNEGVWNKEGKSIDITILPAPWLTWWAYCLYTLAVMMLVGFYALSQKRKIEQERAVSERLRHLDRLKDDFLANTSHELRTPLNGIIGLSQSLVDGVAGELSDEVKFNLQTITHCGRRLANLVNDILDFSRLKNREIALVKRVLDLRLLVDGVFAMSRPLIGNKEIDLANNVDPKLSLVYADEDRLQQILFNIIGNAIKFTENGSVVVAASQDESNIWVSIKDTGIGITDKVKRKIFESFEQVEEHESRSYGGTGLGLTITKQLVEMHGGEIIVESDGVSGADFKFSLPRGGFEQDYVPPISELDDKVTSDQDDVIDKHEVPKALPLLQSLFDPDTDLLTASPSPSHQPKPDADAHKYRILVVDDESVNRQMLVNHLSTIGYRLEEAENGSDALHCIKNKGRFDLVLLDIMMPRMSGYEVCAEIRKQYSMTDLPVLFLTAKNMISDLVDGFDVGANDFLTKPISKGELSSRVRTHIQLLEVNKDLEHRVRERTEEVEKANAILETLDGIVATLNQEVRIDKLLEVLLREASALIPETEKSLYWSYSNQKRAFELQAVRGLEIDQKEKIVFSQEILARYCGMKMDLSADVSVFNLSKEVTDVSSYAGVPVPKSALILPIRYDKVVLGCLMLQNFSTVRAFNKVDNHLLKRFHAHAKSALVKARLMEALKSQNDQLEDATLTDQQTGLRNKRYLLRCLDSDIALSLRLHRKGAAAQEASNADLIFFMLDVDGLGDINKTHGYSAGDKFLHQLKPLMEKVFRQSDFLVRWGGEEFLLVARFSERSAAVEMAERLRRAVAEQAFVMPDGSRIHKTCSVGFAAFPFVTKEPLHYSWSQVVDIANMCLSAAKRSQKNAWVGLMANSEDGNALRYEEVISQPHQLIATGHLQVFTNLSSKKTLKW